MLELKVDKRLNGFALNLDLRAPEEKIIVLFGPSGAGKTMALSAIGGLLTPDSGRIAIGPQILFDSASRIDLPPQKRRVGLVKQDLALFPHLTVEENIAYGLQPQTNRTSREKSSKYLSLMHLDGLGRRRPAELSGGQQQRVALARALAIKPTILLLDEPFSALDRPTRIELREELLVIQRRLPSTILFVTHDLEEAYLLADCMAVIDQGRILQFDTADRVFRAPTCLRVAEIVGIKNILPALVTSRNGLRVGDRDIEVDSSSFASGQKVYACIRPERITLVRRERRPVDLPNVIEGDLVGESNDGSNVMLQFRANSARILPAQEFDLQIDTPVYVYERLNLALQKHWTISIKPGVIHLISA